MKAKQDLIEEMKSGYKFDIVKNLTNNKLLYGILDFNSKEFYNAFIKNVQKTF